MKQELLCLCPIDKKRKLNRTNKYVLPYKRNVAVEVCWETYSKKDYKKSRKTVTDLKYPNTLQIKGEQGLD